MKRLVLRIGLVSIPYLLMVWSNYKIDPAQLFHEEVVTRIATLLSAGQPVAGAQDFDERLLLRAYVARRHQSPDVVVMGSSRAMQIRGGDFPGRSMFNHAVSGASSEDFVAIAGLYAIRGLAPRVVVLVVDPWILNVHNGQLRWQSLAAEYAQMAARLGLASREPLSLVRPRISKVRELFSPAYFQTAVTYWRSKRIERIHVATQIPSDEETILPDGSRVYPSTFNPTSDEIQRAALRYAAGRPMYSLGEFQTLDPDARERVESLIEFYQRAGTRVILLLEPYHPLPYGVIETLDDFRMVPAAEEYFRTLASRRGIECAGSYNPAVVGCTADDFFDGMHPRETCSRRAMATPCEAVTARSSR